MKPTGKVASIPDRIRGSIALVLTLSAFTWADWTNDRQWQMTCMVAGFFYMLTTIAYVFKDVDTIDS
jgi:hypothetical protein